MDHAIAIIANAIWMQVLRLDAMANHHSRWESDELVAATADKLTFALSSLIGRCAVLTNEDAVALLHHYQDLQVFVTEGDTSRRRVYAAAKLASAARTLTLGSLIDIGSMTNGALSAYAASIEAAASTLNMAKESLDREDEDRRRQVTPLIAAAL